MPTFCLPLLHMASTLWAFFPPQWAESRREQPWISYFVALEARCSSASSKRVTLSQPTPDGHSLSTAAVPDTQGDLSSSCTLAPTPLFAVTADCRGSENSKAFGCGMRSSALPRGMLIFGCKPHFLLGHSGLSQPFLLLSKRKASHSFGCSMGQKNSFGEPGCAHQIEPHHLPAPAISAQSLSHRSAPTSLCYKETDGAEEF